MRKIELQQAVPVSVLVGTSSAKLVGDSTLTISGVCPVDELQANCVTFLSGAISQKEYDRLIDARVAAAFVSLEEYNKKPLESIEGIALLLVADPFLGMISVLHHFYEEVLTGEGLSPHAVIDPTARIGKGVTVSAFCFVGADVQLEEGVRLFPHVTVYPGAVVGRGTIMHSGAVIREDCRIGADSVIQNGAIIGADGFGYRPDPEKGLVSFPQVGIVELASRVDVGANACIDRGALGNTSIGLGTKIDNLVQVGHNTKIGMFSILCGQVGVSGSCSIGDQVTLAGGVGVADHVTLPSKSRFGARSGITGSVSESGDYAGWPVSKASEWRRQAAAMRSLPELVKDLRKALKRLTLLEAAGETVRNDTHSNESTSSES